MERVSGQSLLNYVFENGPMNEDQAKHIMKAVVSSVEYMHKNGVVHRDMNPTNVFISEEYIHG